ncbi:MAG: DUF4831 family protein [Bacteroidales bacterium]|nr:DUF4831 family protein [Bacteroidales bacterium]MCF8327689.1 DUF4831 family protein [Bacteroidales bacterium]
MNKIILFFLILTLASCKSHEPGFNVVPVSEVNESENSNEGLYYALPRTRIMVDVQVKKTMSFRGPYAEYASKYLGLDNVTEENKSSFDIQDIKISTIYEADPEQFYFVELNYEDNPRAANLMLELTESGIIANVNDTAGFNTSNQVVFMNDKEKNDDFSKTFSYIPDKNMYEKVDTVIQEVTRDTVTFKKRVLKRKMVQKTTEQKAQEAADFILKVREQKMNLITGYQETPYPQETMEYMFDRLKDMEDKYLKLFTGMQASETLNYRFSFTPPDNVYRINEKLFRFSEEKGVLEKGSEQGEIVSLEINRQRRTKNMYEHIKANYNKDKQRNGFYYRLPEDANIRVKKNEKPLAEVILQISQFGVVNSLPARYNNLRFYPSSGMIKTVNTKE